MTQRDPGQRNGGRLRSAPQSNASHDGREHYFGDDDVAYFDAGSPDALADAVIGVARDPEAAARRAEQAAARFKPYAWTQQQHVYRAVYEALLPPGRRTPTLRAAYGTTIVPSPPEPAATHSV